MTTFELTRTTGHGNNQYGLDYGETAERRMRCECCKLPWKVKVERLRPSFKLTCDECGEHTSEALLAVHEGLLRRLLEEQGRMLQANHAKLDELTAQVAQRKRQLDFYARTIGRLISAGDADEMRAAVADVPASIASHANRALLRDDSYESWA